MHIARCPLLCAALSLCLSACAVASKTPQLPTEDFTAAVEVTRGELTFCADYTRRGETETLRFTAPKTLCGLSAVRDADGCTLSVGTVTAALPSGGIFAPFALFDAPSGCLTESRADGGLTLYTGSRGEDTYRIAVDDAGLPIRLSGRVGGVEAEIRVRRFARIPRADGEKGNAHE